ncbi:hypothetical protein MASR2M48_27130 [Spirochaetota bacterium]
MNYYAVQVWTGKEDEFADRLAGAHAAALKPLVQNVLLWLDARKRIVMRRNLYSLGTSSSA